MTEMIGPRLSDADFFGRIDTTRPGLEGIPEAVAHGDFATARRLFAAEVRRTLEPERFFRIQREFRGAHFMKEGETPEQAGERILSGELISCSTPHQFEGEVDWFINPTFNQYKEWTWQLSRHSEWGILAERYRATGDERFAAGVRPLFRELGASGARAGERRRRRDPLLAHHRGGHPHGRRVAVGAAQLLHVAAFHRRRARRLVQIGLGARLAAAQLPPHRQLADHGDERPGADRHPLPAVPRRPGLERIRLRPHGRGAGCADLSRRLAGRAIHRLSPGGHQQLPVVDRRVQRV